MGFYFNWIYNPVYDFIVGQNAPYHRLQEACIDKLALAEGDFVLCAGVGTGNELLRILKRSRNVRIIGVDASSNALRKAEKKARKKGATIETHLMDVQKLGFPDGTFDKALCIHVTDFVNDSGKATAELVRILKKGGKFAITFPSGKEDFSFGMRIMRDTVRTSIRERKYYRVALLPFTFLLGAIVYSPFLFRKERRQYARNELERLFAPIANGSLQVEEYSVYNDFVVSGRK